MGWDGPPVIIYTVGGIDIVLMDVLIYRWYHHEHMDGKNDILKLYDIVKKNTMTHFFLLPLVLRLTQRIVKLDIP
jgi:hypothetical protein